MTTFVIILGCIAFMFAIYAVRGNPGRAVADTALLVMLIGVIAPVDFVQLYRQQLEANGAEIVGPIATLYGAIDRLRSLGRLDGAVLDINLQGQHVFPLADALAERAIRFVFATAYEVTIVPPRFAEVPVLGKPVAIDEIAAALLPDGFMASPAVSGKSLFLRTKTELWRVGK